MEYDLSLNPYFASVLDDKEQLLWAGRPHFWLFMLSGIPFLVLGLCWGAFDYFGVIRNIPGSMAGFAIPFFAFHLFPFWGSILNMLWLMLAHRNTVYAVSNRRLIIRTGVWGIDFKTVDFDKVTNLDVTVNPLEKMVGAGSIRFDSGATNAKGATLYTTFTGIDQPYDVFKHIKQISLDVKTDWDYPNKLRPEDNPGYKTTYTGGS